MRIENVKGLIEALNSDTRNAMHSILGFLELVSEGALDPAQRECIEACRAAADRHCRAMEDVRVVLGVTAEERQVITHFAPADLFARVVEVIGIFAVSKGVGLFCKVDASVPPVVSADVDRIGHVLLRIAEGVLSTMDGGAVHLNLGALALHGGVDLTFEILAPVRILSPELMRALQQDDLEFDASLSGGGALGLAAARKLATALGSRVEVSSNLSDGTRIVVTIPVGVPAEKEDVAHNQLRLPTQPQPALRILVAEDSEDSFQLFKAYLQGQPHQVARAVNGVEAVELAATGAFDLLFMDIRMPLMDGYTATRQIRRLETGKVRARMPIVVLSAEELRTQRRQGALVGCSGHLSKPLRKHELLEAIKTYSMLKSSSPAA